jgi:hypothetical protein
MQTKEYPEQIRVMYSVWTRRVRRDGDFYPVLAGTFLKAQDAAIKATLCGGEIRKVEV